jgi:hypothetical protein
MRETGNDSRNSSCTDSFESEEVAGAAPGRQFQPSFHRCRKSIEPCTRLNIGAKLSKRRQTEAIEMLSLRVGITLCFTFQETQHRQLGQTVG